MRVRVVGVLPSTAVNLLGGWIAESQKSCFKIPFIYILDFMGVS